MESEQIVELSQHADYRSNQPILFVSILDTATALRAGTMTGAQTTRPAAC